MTVSTSREAAPPVAANALRVAIVGAGKMARHHARAIARPGVRGRVVALAEPDARARESFLEVCPGIASYASLDALLVAEAVDVVHVCTPPPTHEALAVAALEAGRHVYVEKPFAETPEAAERILALARRRNLRVCTGHQLLFEEPSRRALELLPCLGTLHHVESYFAFRPVRTGASGTQPLRADLQLLDILPHPVYSLLHFLELAVPDGESRLANVELGPGGTLHAHVRRGDLTASLVVTLEGRPVESYLRLVGANGALTADFVRSTVQHAIGPGTSFVDKSLNPFRLARQLVFGTSRALAGRLLARQASYPGLAEIFTAFYACIRGEAPPPVSDRNIVETVALCQQVAERLAQPRAVAVLPAATLAPRIAITGGTGFLGTELARSFARRGVAVRVLARREPPPWDRVPGVEYVVADLGRELPEPALHGVDTVLHLAAETAGGFDAHQRNSVDAAERVCRAAAAASARRMIHVSSLAVYASPGREPVRESTPIEPKPRERGPYVWGKVESEQVLARVARELGLRLEIVRPGAIIDRERFDPPGRLGRRIGNVFVAVGSPSERLGVIERRSAAELLAWMALHPDASPDALNLLEPTLPTKRELVALLRQTNPDLLVVWLPNFALASISRVAVVAQRVLRRGREPVDLQKVFAVDRYDTSAVAALSERIAKDESAGPPARLTTG